MNILVVLIPASLILGGLGLAAFLWTLRSNQYDDLEGDAWRILSEDDDAPRAKDEPR
jgi:cbb3-type cytochrome oxidase maturation protein